jgi:hypothetical protein
MALTRWVGRDARRTDDAPALEFGYERVPSHARARTGIAARAGMGGRRLGDCLCPQAIAISSSGGRLSLRY